MKKQNILALALAAGLVMGGSNAYAANVVEDTTPNTNVWPDTDPNPNVKPDTEEKPEVKPEEKPVKKNDNPKTGVAGMSTVASLAAVSLAGIVATRKKNN